MKTSKDPRHLRRKKAVKALYSEPFLPQGRLADELARQVMARSGEIDPLIGAAAPEWSIKKINRVDLAILRLAVWELVIEKKAPPKVVIDEAVELAKRYGAEGSSRFVNGVLGTIMSQLQATGAREEATGDK